MVRRSLEKGRFYENCFIRLDDWNRKIKDFVTSLYRSITILSSPVLIWVITSTSSSKGGVFLRCNSKSLHNVCKHFLKSHMKFWAAGNSKLLFREVTKSFIFLIQSSSHMKPFSWNLKSHMKFWAQSGQNFQWKKKFSVKSKGPLKKPIRIHKILCPHCVAYIAQSWTG